MPTSSRGSRPSVLDAHGSWKISLLHAAWISVAAALALSLIGVYTIDVALRPETGGMIADKALRQLVFLGIGIFCGAVVALPHYRIFARLAWPSMVISVGL